MKKSLWPLFFLSFSLYAQTSVYQWTDAQGQIHYSDQAVGNATVKTLDPAPNPATSAGAQATQQLMDEQAQKKKEENIKKGYEDLVAQEKEADKKRQSFCETTAAGLATLKETGRRVYEILPDGTFHYFNDDERAKKILELETKMKEQRCS